MSNLRSVLFALCAGMAAISTFGDTNFVKYGKYDVHPTRILARFNDQVALESTTKTLHSAGLKVSHSYQLVSGLVSLDADERLAQSSTSKATPEEQAELLKNRIEALKASGLFAYVEPSYIVHTLATPTDARFADFSLWGLTNNGANGGVVGADISAPQAWNITTGSTNVIVAVIDTGIRYTHKDLAANMWVNPKEIAGNGLDDDNDGVIDDVYGFNAVANNGDPMDDNDHGTHCAGTIGAVGNDGNPLVGVNWRVRLMACKFLTAGGFGSLDDAIKCIDFAVAHGAKVLNNSWGGGPFEQALFDSIAAAQAKGVLFVAAAGNDANNNDGTPSYPASYQLANVISVAALDRADKIADFSNYGSSTVHLGAPGVDILSSTAGSDTEYQLFSGTSMAAPHVSGVAALILAKQTNALLAEIKERIVSQTVPIAALKGKSRSGGRLNAFKALSAAADGVLELTVAPPSGSQVLAGSTTVMTVTVTDLFGLTNAVVKGSFNNSTNIIDFKDNGGVPDAKAADATYSANVTFPTNATTAVFVLNVTAPGKTNATETLTYQVLARPANDNFANSAKIPTQGGLIEATNKFATTETGEPRHAGVASMDASLWWKWSPSVTGNVIIDTTGSKIDTVIGVYTNNTLTTLREVVSVDDVGFNGAVKQGYVNLTNVIPGLTYYIAVASAGFDDVGEIRLRLEYNGKPDLDAPTVVITSPASGTIITNPADTKIVITGTAADPQPNSSGLKEVLVKLNDGLATPAYGTSTWSSTNLLENGINTITVLARDYAGNVSSPRTINVTFKPLTNPNDAFNRAIQLTGASGRITADSTGTTKEPGEPFHAGNQGGKSLWYYFRAPADGVLKLTLTNATFDTLLGVYTGTRVNALTLVGSNDDATSDSNASKLAQPVLSGRVYMVAVDGFGAGAGTFNLDYSFEAGGLHIVTVTSTEGGTVSPGTGSYPSGVSVSFMATASANFQFVRWEGAATSSLNPVSVVVNSDLQLKAVFEPYSFSDGFESGNLTQLGWKTPSRAGDVAWTVQTSKVSQGKYAARSGALTDGQTSSLLLTAETPAGVGSFSFKVSSEAGWDYLEFFANGRRLEKWSGEIGWLTFSFNLPAGLNTLEWRYVKDPVDGTSGDDAAFLDNLDLPKKVIVGTGDLAARIENLPNGKVRLVLDGSAGQSIQVETSSDLIHWSPLTTTLSEGGVVEFSASADGTRFYRFISETAAQ